MLKKIIFLLMLISYTLSSQTIYVDQNATGSNDGTDWANAYTNLQTAIANIGTTTTINVAQGTYYTTTTTDRTISFNIPRDKKLYGGFPTGGGTSNPDLYPTILSGDIGTIGDNTDNSYHVVYFYNSSATNEFDGFIVEKGYADGSGTNENQGGGVLVKNSSSGSYGLYMKNCTIRNNYAVNGGGVEISKKADIYNCKIYSNQAEQTGGGISIDTDGRIYNSYIANNSAQYAGGIHISGFNSAPKAIGCVIANNEASVNYPAARTDSYLINCTIVNNNGGDNGVRLDTDGGVWNCIIWGNETTTNQVNIPGSSSTYYLQNNIVQNLSPFGTNISLSSANNGNTFGENYPRFTKPTTFTGNATTQAQLNEILNADWSINPQSAAIDFGDNSLYPTTTDTPTVDIIGNTRTINTTIDTGAFEALTNIITTDATNQQPTSADLNGEVLFAETTNTITRGFVYTTTPNFDVTTATSITNSGTGLGVYTDAITGLTENQIYYYRTWVQFDGVKYYGNEIQFKASNLVAYYPFNGNANDESGNNHNGTVNGATLTTDRNGNANSAYSFDGSSNYISITDNPNINIQAGASFSVSYWIKHNAQNKGRYIVSKYMGSIGLDPSYGLGTGSIGDSYSWFEFSAGTGIENRGTANLNDSNWHNITTVFTSGVSVSIYVDGVLDISNTTTYSGSIINTNNLTIGCGANLAQFYNGSIDDVKIYNKALTATEIQNEANGLIAYYPFNGNANDESGNNLNGTVSGASLTMDRFNNSSSAYSFDGSDIITIDHNDLLNSSNELSISVWVKPNIQQDAMILGKSNYTTATNYLLRTKSTGFIQFEYKDFANSSSLPLIVSQWNHIAVVSHSDNSKQVYINGVLAMHTTATSPFGLVNNALTIGARSGGENFQGSIDDLRIYKSALTAQQVSNLFNLNTLKIDKFENMATNNFYVHDNILYFKNTQNLSDIKNIEVYNLLGQKVFKTSKIETQIPITNLQKGMYILKVENLNGNYQTIKFLSY